MKYSEIKRKLKKGGCHLYREGRNHELWFSPTTGITFPLSRHNKEEAATKTLKSIEKQSGIKF
ncbi:MAG: type II toxin-antitoxin system HicA family toxin [Flavobacteriaceae bacterium]